MGKDAVFLSVAGLALCAVCPPLGVAVTVYGILGGAVAVGDGTIAQECLDEAGNIRKEAEDVKKHGCG
ncbi:MAG: hypothetical protein HXS48_01060 [Theionarchaea archaeon]|nr:hypothetical protein [Theionarchaea archaeon]